VDRFGVDVVVTGLESGLRDYVDRPAEDLLEFVGEM
jgi:hypothetical protein